MPAQNHTSIQTVLGIGVEKERVLKYRAPGDPSARRGVAERLLLPAVVFRLEVDGGREAGVPELQPEGPRAREGDTSPRGANTNVGAGMQRNIYI